MEHVNVTSQGDIKINESTNHEIHGYHVIHNKIIEKKNKSQLTNLLELLFLTVLALPKASKRGLDSKMTSLTFCGNMYQ